MEERDLETSALQACYFVKEELGDKRLVVHPERFLAKA